MYATMGKKSGRIPGAYQDGYGIEIESGRSIFGRASAFGLLREPLALLVGKELIAMDKIKAP